MTNKWLLVSILVFGLSTGANARNCIDPYSIGENQMCEVSAEGSGSGRGMKMFWNRQTNSIVVSLQKNICKIVSKHYNKAEMIDGKYNGRFQRMFVNACLATVGLSLK